VVCAERIAGGRIARGRVRQYRARRGSAQLAAPVPAPGAGPVEENSRGDQGGAEGDQGDLPDDGYWDLHSACAGCNYPERAGDLRSIIKVADFYSARQGRRTGMYTDYYRPAGLENDIMLTLPAGRGPAARAARSVRLIFLRGPGPDFSERDRDEAPG
jgi:hypothetical protein